MMIHSVVQDKEVNLASRSTSNMLNTLIEGEQNALCGGIPDNTSSFF